MEKKIIVIGDLHGKNIWEEILEKENDFDKAIFIGDYFDSFNIPFIEQYSNFKKIIEFKELNKKKVILLIANHDYHYIKFNPQPIYSGFQNNHFLQINELIEKNIKNKNLQMCYSIGEYIFTHAGITKTWLKNVGFKSKNYKDVSNFINELFYNKPIQFRFNGHDMYGDDITQSPIWVRPRSLLSDKIDGFKQVVGHTRVSKIEEINGVCFIDVLDENLPLSDKYLILYI